MMSETVVPRYVLFPGLVHVAAISWGQWQRKELTRNRTSGWHLCAGCEKSWEQSEKPFFCVVVFILNPIVCCLM